MKQHPMTLLLAGAVPALMMTAPAFAEGALTPFQLPMGQVGTFEVPEGITTVVVGDPTVAIVQVPPGQNKLALITAKSPGITNILVWTEKRRTPYNYVIEVIGNRRSEQIVCRVKVLEVSTGADGKVGIEWFDKIRLAEAPPDAPFKFGLPTRTDVIDATIHTMIHDRKAKLLAQPTLVMQTGEKASFLSGGQFPYTTVSLNGVNVEWKDFGTKLVMEGKVLGTDDILLTLNPSVSDLDRVNSVTAQGQNFPSVATREAQTTVRIKSGQSLVIAGLMQDKHEEVIHKFPLLGDIPVLGHLFKANEFHNIKSEIVFIVTPMLLPATGEVLPEAKFGQ